MQKTLEKISLLSLSLMLISSYSISSALPLMKEYFQGYGSEQIELLISMPSFFVIVLLLCNSWLNRLFTERQIILMGLLTMAVAGLVPIAFPSYWVVLISRMFFGMGTGMINAKAISMISERYSGRERVQMLGLRGSAEVVGSAFLTMLVGRLVTVGWTWAFAIYGFALVLLVLYLLFVPQATTVRVETRTHNVHLTRTQWLYSLSLAVIAFWEVCINSSINLRVPFLITESAMGSVSDVSHVLSFQQLIGIASGVLFSPLLTRFRSRLLSLSWIGFACSLVGIALANQLVLLGIAAIGTGFFNSLIVIMVFHLLSENMPSAIINTATALVLLGCNFGSALSPYVLQLLGLFLPSSVWIFLFYGGSSLTVAIYLFVRERQNRLSLRVKE